MRYQTEPFGIKVVLIEPGIIRSNFLGNAKVAQKTGGAQFTLCTNVPDIPESRELVLMVKPRQQKK